MKTISNLKSQISNRRSGVATLGATLILAAVVIEIGIVGFFLVKLLTNVNLGVRQAAVANESAEAGFADAVLRIVRGTVNPNDYSYVVVLDGVDAGITICGEYVSGCPVFGNADQYSIIAATNVAGKKGIFSGVVEKDPVTGRVIIISSTSQ